jgi:hypothetical protein
VAAITPQRLLSIWEQGMQRHPIDRALLLLSLARPEAPAEQLADLPLGTCNAALMALQRACFSARLPAWLDCLACGERMEFELDAAQLPPTDTAPVDSVEVDGHRFACPTSRHLARLARRNDDAQSGARQLLLDCAQDADALPREQAALAELLQHAESAIEAADPWVNIAIEVRCPACDGQDLADFDIAAYLWHQIEQRARQLLGDIHLLAQAYGWTEPDILALSETRRAAYLARVLA